MNVCPSGSVAAVSLTHSHTHTHSGLLSVWRQQLLSSLSRSVSRFHTHSLWGREEECLIGGAVVKRVFTQCMWGVGQSKGAPSYTYLLYFFLSSFSLSHPRTLLSSFSGSKRDVCADACDCVRWTVNEVVYWLSNSSLQVATDRKLFSLTWNQFPEFLHSETFKDKKFEAQWPSCSFKPEKVCEIFSFLFLRNRYLHVTVCFVLL